ncbi:MAG: metallophosphoesterase [Oscillospiraceae bacterium]|nr:metallophosphoesterase [Oscillospiraceae bacterium]
MRKITKSLFIILLCLTMLFTAIPVAAQTASPARLQIAVFSDTHFFSPTQMGYLNEAWQGYTNPSGSRMLQQSAAILDSALAAVAANPNIGYLLIAGDLTREGEIPGHEIFAARMLRFQEETGIQVAVVPGNHDINTYRGLYFGNNAMEQVRSVTAPEFWELYQNLGPHLPNMDRFVPARGNSGGMLSYAVDLSGGAFRLIALDVVKHSPDVNPDGYAYHTGGVITDDLLAWAVAQTEAAVAAGQIPIGLMHHMFLSHLPTVIEGRGMNTNFQLDNGIEAAEALANAGMRFAFTGHGHTHSISNLITDDGDVLYDIQTGSLINYPATFRQVSITAHNPENIVMDIRMRDVDAVLPVRREGQGRGAPSPGNYPSPFAVTSMDLSFGAENMPAFVLTFLNGALRPIYRDGGIVAFMRDGDLDLYAALADAIGNFLPGIIARRLSRNVMGLVWDLLGQVDANFFDDFEGTMDMLVEVVDDLFYLEVSDYPSQRFYQRYGIGNPRRRGNLGDLVGEGLAYQYGRWPGGVTAPFSRDVIENLDSGELTAILIDSVLDIVLELVQEQILDGMHLNLSALFVNRFTRATFGALLDQSVRAVLGGDNSFDSLLNFGLRVANTFNIVPYTNLDELVDGIMEMFLTDELMEVFSYTLARMITSFVASHNDIPDLNVTLRAQGPRRVSATQDNGRLPTHLVQQLPTVRDNFDRVFSWHTRHSVIGTDIRVWNADRQEVTDSLTITRNRELVAVELPGIDLGIATMRDVPGYFNRHSLTISGLTPGATYTFQVGDADRGWWSPTGQIHTEYRDQDSTTFLVFGDQSGMLPAQFARSWGTLSNAASTQFPRAAFAISTGTRVANATNFDQWQWFFASAQDALLDLPLMPVHVSAESDAMADFFAGQESYFAFTHGNLHVMMIDTREVVHTRLRSANRRARADWNIAVLNQAPSAHLRWRLGNAGFDLIIDATAYDDMQFGAVIAEEGALRHEIWSVDERGRTTLLD